MKSRTYQLYVKIAGRWQWLCDIQAATHPEAFREAMICLKPEHYDKPIRLEAAETTGTPGGASAPVD